MFHNRDKIKKLRKLKVKKTSAKKYIPRHRKECECDTCEQSVLVNERVQAGLINVLCENERKI